MQAQLVPLGDGPSVNIEKDMTLVGRGDNCDLQLEHKSVSKLHCVLVVTDGLVLLRDLGSTNGTRVNGQRVRRAALLPNDQLNIASLKFRILFGPQVKSKVSPDEQTQHIQAEDLNELLRGRGDGGDDDEDSIEPVQTNALPDVYEEENLKKEDNKEDKADKNDKLNKKK